MPRPKRTEIEYRNYNLPPEFPVLALSGDSWHISDVPSKRLHFHNCLEIGLCQSDHGTLKWENQEVEFHAGDVTCISRNVPHTTYSAPGESSLWSYLFLDPLSLLGIQTIAMLEREFAVQSMLTNCHILISPETDPQIGHLIQSIIDEINSRSEVPASLRQVHQPASVGYSLSTHMVR